MLPISIFESKGSLQNFLYLKWIQGLFLLFLEISKHIYTKGKINTWSSFKIEYEKKREDHEFTKPRLILKLR